MGNCISKPQGGPKKKKATSFSEDGFLLRDYPLPSPTYDVAPVSPSERAISPIDYVMSSAFTELPIETAESSTQDAALPTGGAESFIGGSTCSDKEAEPLAEDDMSTAVLPTGDAFPFKKHRFTDDSFLPVIEDEFASGSTHPSHTAGKAKSPVGDAALVAHNVGVPVGDYSPPADNARHSVADTVRSDGGASSHANVSLGEVQIGIAQPVVIMRSAKLVATKSLADLRSGSIGRANPIRPLPNMSSLTKSATMGDINKPLPAYPNNDPIAAYVERNNMIVKSASQVWEERSKELLELYKKQDAEFAAQEEEERASTGKKLVPSKSSPDLYMGPIVDKEAKEKFPTAISAATMAASSTVPSKAYHDAIRDLSRAGGYKLRGDSLRGYGHSADTEFYPAHACPDLTVRHDAPMREPVQFQPGAFLRGPSEPGPSQPSPPQSTPQIPKRYDVPRKPVHPTLRRLVASRNHRFWVEAVNHVNKKHTETGKIICGKVAKHAKNDSEAELITCVIMSIDEEVVARCVNCTKDSEYVGQVVQTIRAGFDSLRDRAWFLLLWEILRKDSGVVKQGKAMVLLKKWAANAEAEKTAIRHEKGKGKLIGFAQCEINEE
ncbi:hypothetical protein AAE478_000593 [Parahypoxylon ruwenzoriense]